MQFEKGHIFHIYNQGNNQQRIFFNRENYLFFLKKIRKYILPYADVLAWCLMPNHFHLMVLVNEVELMVSTDPMTLKDDAKLTAVTDPMTLSHRISKKQTLNNSIAIMLRSYTRAINKQQKITGTLFRQKTKAECLTDLHEITPAFFNTSSGTLINIVSPGDQYPQICFDYIHYNPVKAGLVKKETGWEFSSARDFAGLRNGKLVNKGLAMQYIEYSSDDLKSSDE